jgi:hypothetical protein
MEPIERAQQKLKTNAVPYDVAAACVGELDAGDFDGRRWHFVVIDGRHVGELDAQLAGTQAGTPDAEIDQAALERAVEHRAGTFPRDGRLAALVEQSPLTLRRDDLPR